MIGRTVLHYEITAELGAGGMGRVYLARDLHTERRVALKFVANGSAQEAGTRERFLQEARASARLSHPGIVGLHAVEEIEGQVFLVQEFVEGETLEARLQRGPMGVQATLRLARELAAALAHAHRQGVLHRDLKPANVLLAADGSAKIADFGIARIEGEATLTATGTLVGSLHYLAPERVSGARGDARADLFALGAVLYEVMSGRRAFPGEDAPAVLYSLMNETPATLEPHSAALRPLARLVMRLLAKDPAQRPASAEVVAGIAEEFQTASHPATPRRRARWIPWAVGGVVVAALIVAALLWRGRSEPGGAGAAQPSVAVLYFENLVDPADQERIGSITGNLLITSLAQTADLNVLSTQRILDAMRQVNHRAGGVDRRLALEVAKRAGARRIVTGTVLQTAPTIVMTAEVSEVGSGKVLDAVRIEGEPGQTVFQVVDALGARLMQKMTDGGETARLAPVAERSSTNLEAQRRYAEGLERLASGELTQAAASFRQAIGLDPEFAQAHFQLAIVEWWTGEPQDAAADVAAAQAQAARLSPLEREVTEGIGALVRLDYEAAESRFRRLARIHPDEKLVQYGLVEAAFHNNRFGAAIEAARRALAIDPDFTIAGVHLVDALTDTGRLAEAETKARELLRRNPDNAPLWHSLHDLMLERGDGAAALAVAEEAHRAGAHHALMTISALLLAFNLHGEPAAREWTVRVDSTALATSDLNRFVDYLSALRRGRLRAALAISQRAWDAMPAGGVRGRPAIPVANGWAAAAAARDIPSAMRWADSSVVRRARFDPHQRLDMELGKAELQLSMGLGTQASLTLRQLEARPEFREPRYEPYVRHVTAMLESAAGRHAEAEALLKGAIAPGPLSMEWGMTALSRLEVARAAGRNEAVIALTDTLLRTPAISPDQAVRLYFHRAQALERLNRVEPALQSYRDFLERWKGADAGIPEVDQARAAVRRLDRGDRTL